MASERGDALESEAVAKIMEIYGADRSELRSFEDALRQAYRSGYARAQSPVAFETDMPPSIAVQCQQLRERVVGLEKRERIVAVDLVERIRQLEARVTLIEQVPAVESDL